MNIKLYGTPDSVYVRIVRLVLLAKGARFAMVEADPFEGGSLPFDYNQRHPFKKIPAIEIDGFRLYETDAIVHYIDALIDHPKLIPSSASDAALMRQLMRIVDAYAYRPLVWGLYVPIYWRDGLAPTDEAIAQSRQVLGVIEGIIENSPAAGFATPTLATFYMLSVLAAADTVDPGTALIDEKPRLREWWDSMRVSDDMVKTRPNCMKY
ncbi:glutathione S-transferase family protein [Phyllobacterium sp. SB3]|uniref:glutathione S-transferase family protein n=1 Tax=Phyllobacterium sp. SB3 TaxID=3156073 RepID=UPI0032AFB8C6